MCGLQLQGVDVEAMEYRFGRTSVLRIPFSPGELLLLSLEGACRGGVHLIAAGLERRRVWPGCWARCRWPRGRLCEAYPGDDACWCSYKRKGLFFSCLVAQLGTPLLPPSSPQALNLLSLVCMW